MTLRRRQKGPPPDAYERAVLEGPQADEDGVALDPQVFRSGLQIGRRRIGALPLLGFLLGLVLLSATLRGGTSTGPELKRSCTTPALALLPERIETRQPVRYALVGPAAGGDVVLTVDATALRPDLTAVSVPGQRGQVVAPAHPLAGCRVTGTFTVDLPAGGHLVTAFRTAGSAEPVPLTTRQLIVVGR